MPHGSSMKGKEKIEQSIPEGEYVQNSVAKEVIKIGNNEVVMGDCFKGSVIINGFAQTQIGNSSQSSHERANDHEASSSKPDPKYHQLRWCPDGLTHTQKGSCSRCMPRRRRSWSGEGMKSSTSSSQWRHGGNGKPK
jgi:hypothetical protein